MVNFTSNTYQMKREILNFSHKISHNLSKPGRKFSADTTYDMLASGSCLLTDVADQLHEDSKRSTLLNALPLIWQMVLLPPHCVPIFPLSVNGAGGNRGPYR